MIISEQINQKVNSVIKGHSEMLEEIIKKLIVENDCKPSDVHIVVKGHMHYSFLIKKHESKTEINCIWGFDDNQ